MERSSTVWPSSLWLAPPLARPPSSVAKTPSIVKRAPSSDSSEPAASLEKPSLTGVSESVSVGVASSPPSDQAEPAPSSSVMLPSRAILTLVEVPSSS